MARLVGGKTEAELDACTGTGKILITMLIAKNEIITFFLMDPRFFDIYPDHQKYISNLFRYLMKKNGAADLSEAPLTLCIDLL